MPKKYKTTLNIPVAPATDFSTAALLSPGSSPSAASQRSSQLLPARRSSRLPSLPTPTLARPGFFPPIKGKEVLTQFKETYALTDEELSRFQQSIEERNRFAENFEFYFKRFIVALNDIEFYLAISKGLDSLFNEGIELVKKNTLPDAGYHTIYHALELVEDVTQSIRSSIFNSIIEKKFITELARIIALFHDVIQNQNRYFNEVASAELCLNKLEAVFSAESYPSKKALLRNTWTYVIRPWVKESLVNGTTITVNKNWSYFALIAKLESILQAEHPNIQSYREKIRPVFLIEYRLALFDVHRSLFRTQQFNQPRYPRLTSSRLESNLLTQVNEAEQGNLLMRLGQNVRMFIEINRFTKKLNPMQVSFFIDQLNQLRVPQTSAELIALAEQHTEALAFIFDALIESFKGEACFAEKQNPNAIFEAAEYYGCGELYLRRGFDLDGWTKHAAYLTHLSTMNISVIDPKEKAEMALQWLFIAAQQEGCQLLRNRTHLTPKKPLVPKPGFTRRFTLTHSDECTQVGSARKSTPR